jgi:hypothetical protein
MLRLTLFSSAQGERLRVQNSLSRASPLSAAKGGSQRSRGAFPPPEAPCLPPANAAIVREAVRAIRIPSFFMLFSSCANDYKQILDGFPIFFHGENARVHGQLCKKTVKSIHG